MFFFTTNQNVLLERGSGCWRCCSDWDSRGGRCVISCVTKEPLDENWVRKRPRGWKERKQRLRECLSVWITTTTSVQHGIDSPGFWKSNRATRHQNCSLICCFDWAPTSAQSVSVDTFTIFSEVKKIPKVSLVSVISYNRNLMGTTGLSQTCHRPSKSRSGPDSQDIWHQDQLAAE